MSVDMSHDYVSVDMSHDYLCLWTCHMTICVCGHVTWLSVSVDISHDYLCLWTCHDLLVSVDMSHDLLCEHVTWLNLWASHIIYFVCGHVTWLTVYQHVTWYTVWVGNIIMTCQIISHISNNSMKNTHPIPTWTNFFILNVHDINSTLINILHG